MSSEYDYGPPYYARQGGGRDQQAHMLPQRSDEPAQLPPHLATGYNREPFTEQYTAADTRNANQWITAHGDHHRAHAAFKTPQSSARSYQTLHDNPGNGELQTFDSASLGYTAAAPPPMHHHSSNHTSAPSYYRPSPPQFSQTQHQQQQQRTHHQSSATNATNSYSQSQYGQSQQRQTSINSVASGRSDSHLISTTQGPSAYYMSEQAHEPRTGSARSSDHQQSDRPAALHSMTTSRTGAANRQVSQPQYEAVAANISATRVSAPPDQAQSSTTVDPTQVYDPFHEYQRQVARRAEAKKAQDAKDKIEQDRLAKEKELASAAAQSQVAAETPDATKPPRGAPTGGRKTALKRGSRPNNTADDMSAAMTLMQASSANNPNATQSEKDSLQAQMMEMFKKMREFNEKDPQMLSRLWQQERDQHLAQSSPAKSTPSSATASATGTAQKRGPKPGWKASKAATAAATSDASSNAGASAPASSRPQHSSATPVPRLIPVPPPSSRTTGTVWPAETKGTLAQAAVDFIKTNLDNRHIDITASEISAILDTNPNYVELCQAIEKRGIKIDRSTFAKHLLKSTPGSKLAGAQASNGQASTSRNGAQSVPAAEFEARLQSGEPLLPIAQPKSTGGKSRKDNSSGPSPQSKPRTPKTSALAGSPFIVQPAAPVDLSLDGLDAVKAFVDDKNRPAFFPSGTKTKAAKKAPRQRHEASVSMTPVPALKEELARKRTFGDLVDLTTMSESEAELETSYPPAKRRDQGLGTNIDPNLQATPAEDGQGSAETIAPDINWDGFGPRPTAVPDVAALMRPMQTFASRAAVPQAQDQRQREPLSWASRPTVLEPLKDSANSTAVIAASQAKRTAILALPLDKSKALRRSTYDARTIARDVLLACGRHPEMRHLNAHLEHLKVAFPSLSDNNADLSTINWAVIDPGGPLPGSGTRAKPEAPIDVGDEADDEEDDDDDKMTKPLGPGREKASGTPRARLGKPTVTPNTSSPGRVLGYVALRPVDEHGNPIKKKGRPVGWRKWMQKDGAGTPGKAPSVAKSKKPEPEAVYQVYKCEWLGCRAELHNLETLRRHIHKVHGKQPDAAGLWPCHWESCSCTSPSVGPRPNETTPRQAHYCFAAKQDWKNHIEALHIQPIAWRLGDGPAGGISDRDSELSEAYMSDRQGRRVTPQIPIPEEGTAAAGSAMLRRFKRTAEEEAQQEQANAERKKRDTGPGVDKGGARLANEKRRQGFMDDLSDAQLIDDDEH